MTAEPTDFAIDRDKVARFLFWTETLLIGLIFIWLCGLGLLLAVIYAFTIGRWLPKKQADALRYWLDGSTLRVNSGVYFVKQKAIPLDRVTDVVLSQGPVMRWFGIWALQIQTAGTGQMAPEATLWGLIDPEGVRDTLLKARDAAAAGGPAT